MWRNLNYSGFVIASIGFFLTRFNVTIAIADDPVVFYFAGVVPLAIGLGLAAFGVALAVADVDSRMVRRTAIWCVIGLVTMLVLVVLTILGSDPGHVTNLTELRSHAYFSNFLIAGSAGGTITGLYAARNRKQRRQLEQQANRLVTLNRFLRHEILNAVTAIRGYARLDPNDNTGTMDVVDDHAKEIARATEEIKYLTQHTGGSKTYHTDIYLEESITSSVMQVHRRYARAQISVDEIPEGLTVQANHRLEQVLVHLLENAIIHGNDETPTIKVEPHHSSVTIRVTNEGPPLPERQQRLLESGAIEEFDDPMSGFGLNIVRLLIESYGGSIHTASSNGQTSIEIHLKRNGTRDDTFGPRRSDLSRVRPAIPHLVVVFGASLVAAVVYGLVAESLGGSIAGIGVFYGTADPVVGWLTHEFHSVVFGFMYVGILSLALERYRDRTRTYVTVAIVWSIVVWFVAASIIAPIWLQLMGIPASVPTFAVDILLNHLAWGISLGLLTAWGYRYVVPGLQRLGDWFMQIDVPAVSSR